MKRKIVYSSFVAILILNAPLNAANTVESAIKNAFGASRVMTNSTGASTWTDPSSGATYYSGGGLTVKFKNNAAYTPWIDAREPSIKAGCEGFSFDAGFIQMIDLDGITDQLTQAGTSIVGGFVSSLLYSTPILGDVIAFVKKISEEITAMLQNACNLGKYAGTATLSGLSKIAADADIDEYITTAKDTGQKAVALKHIDSVKSSIKNTLKNILDSNASAGSGASATTNQTLNMVPYMYSKKVKSLNIKNYGASPLFSKIEVVKSQQNAFIVDAISLSDYLNASSSKSSKFKKLKIPSLITKYGTSISTLIMLSQKQELAPNPVCSAIYDIMKQVDPSASVTDKEQAVVDLKKSLEDPKIKDQPIDNKTSYLAVKLSDDTYFNIEKDMASYIIEGKVLGKKPTVENAEIVVVQYFTDDSVPKDRSNTKTEKVVLLCSPQTNKTFTPSWSGIGTRSKMENEIIKISEDKPSGSLNTSVPITAEVAKLSKILGKKNKILSSGEKVVALTITSYNLSLLNQYILASRLLEAIYEERKRLASSTGSSSNAAASAKKATEEDLVKLKEDVKKELSGAMGTEHFMDSIMRDVKEIERTYDVLKAKRQIRLK